MALLRVRVNDPDKVLAKAKKPLAYDPQLQLTIKKSGGMPFAYLPVSSQDGAGTNYDLAVPYDTPLSLSVASPANILDTAGKPAQLQTPLQFPKGAKPQLIVLTIHKKLRGTGR